MAYEIRVTLGGETVSVPDTGPDSWKAPCDALVAKHGTANGFPKVERVETVSLQTSPETPGMSTWEKPVLDEAGKARAEKIGAALAADGILLDRSEQAYDTGTRLAAEGVATQTERATEHGEKELAPIAIARFIARIEGEKRFSREVTARELAGALSMNGAPRFEGYKLREQAIRGMLTRLDSPALRYVLGLRDRIAANVRAPILEEGETETDESKARRLAQATVDRAKLLATLVHELKANADVVFKMRCRQALGDIFAIVSPGYGEADAPEVLPDVLDALPGDARATVAYDPATTTWELRAEVWTPTPADLQVVGEPFSGYVAFTSRDNGTGSLGGGGGILILRCLNATTYAAGTSDVSRKHRKNILLNLRSMIQESTSAIHTLVNAWGSARETALRIPSDDSGVLIPLETVIPGFFRHMLTARRGELVSVLPGRTEKHVQALAEVYPTERRDGERIVRADLANAYTRYIQTQPAPVRRAAESAIGRWVVSTEPVHYAAI